MGLRATLQDLMSVQNASNSAREATSAYAQGTDALQKQQDLRALASQIPGALSSGNINQLAGDAYALGDNSVLKNVLDQGAKINEAKAKAATNTGAMSLEDLRTNYPEIDDAKLVALAKIPSFADQQKALNTGAQIMSREDSKLARQTDTQLRKEKYYEDSRTKFLDTIERNIKPYRKNVEDIEKLDQMDPNDRIQFWTTATNIVKKIGADAGALSDQDLNRPYANTVGKNVREIGIWMGQVDPSTISFDPRVIDSVKEIISKMKDFQNRKLNERAAIEIKKQAEARKGKLFDKDGNPTQLVQDVAAEYGQVAAKDSKGNFQVGTNIPTGKSKLDPDVGGPDTMIMVQKLPPDRQAKFLQVFKRYSDQKEPVPAQVLEQLKLEAGQ